MSRRSLALLPRLRRALVAAAAPAVVACGVLSAMPAAAQWSTSSVFTDDGVEIGVEPRLFALFALLNEAGYDKETVLGGEPILRPKFSEVREKLRGNMGRSVNKPLVELVDKNPASIAVYVDAVLQLGPAPRFDDKAATSPLAKALAPFMREWYNEEGGSSHLRNAVEAARDTQKRLLGPTNTAIVAVTKLVRLGDASEQLLEDDGGAHGRVALVINDLDAHGALLVVSAKDTAGIIAGPFRTADDETRALDAVVFAYANSLVAAEVAKVNAEGTLLSTFDTVSPTTKAAYADAKAWGKALMSCAVSREVLARTSTCGALAGDAASDAALALIAPRMHEFAPTTALFAAALPELLAAPPPPPPPPPVVEEPKGKGKKK